MSCKPKRKRKCRLVEEVLIYNDFFMSRQKGSINNLIWGVVSVIITSVVAFIIPRLFIVNYGSEVNGLLASIRQIYVGSWSGKRIGGRSLRSNGKGG